MKLPRKKPGGTTHVNQNGMENDCAEFAARQNAVPGGEAVVQFMELWSSMMEYSARKLSGASQELFRAVPKLADAYPCILETTPNLLEVHQTASCSPQENSVPFPSMSM